MFNYLGIFQGQEQSSGLLRPVPFNKGDVGPQVRRFSLFEVNTYIIDGSARFAIAFNRNMKRQPEVKAWFGSYKATLLEMAQSLKDAPVLGHLATSRCCQRPTMLLADSRTRDYPNLHPLSMTSKTCMLARQCRKVFYLARTAAKGPINPDHRRDPLWCQAYH